MAANEILKIYGTGYEAMTRALLEEAALDELIGDRRRRIGIKPNLVSPTPAEYGATTHPEIVDALISYLLEKGFEDITVMEGSWVGDRTSDAFEYCGYNAISRKYPVIRLFDTQKDSSVPVDCGDGIVLNICRIVKDIDFLINVPVLKGHCQTKMTCALKNLKGLIPNSEKRRFHSMGLHRPIAYLQKAIHQDFVLVDHICGDLDFEDGGNPVVRNCIMAAVDPVLADCLACRITGHELEEVGYLALAASMGIGSTDLSHAMIRDLTEGSEGSPFAEAKEDQGHRRILDVSYSTEEVESCSACYASLTAALLRLKDEGLLDKLDEKISIGQGFRGKTGKLGVGMCTKDFEFFIPGCPPDEEAIYRGLAEYIRKNEDKKRTGG
ncbi:MAG: DUF362 domain-containing protein [Lachnospiraceae bacterium]|nr:DUF362 domain-containing protein [Lachnospiraceae bacterium]